jgi:thiol-disulfide isomerase/thioredoxin
MLQVLLTLALYDGDPFVKSPHSFSDIGPHSTSYVALEFYAGWCGHCQAFAPTWKEVARHACAAAPRLQFVAVDCASDFLLCQEMQVPSFPTIRLFGPRLPALGHELSTCLHGCKTSAETLDEVVHLVREVAPSALPAHSSTELAGLSERSSCATEAQTVGYQTPG